MSKYEKPIVLTNSDLFEGVYAASGTVNTGSYTPSCDSSYMGGNWQAPDYNNTTSNIGRYGCDGCPAFRWNGCGLKLDYIDSNNAESYKVDDGKRKPGWERKGLAPDGFTYDWNA